MTTRARRSWWSRGGAVDERRVGVSVVDAFGRGGGRRRARERRGQGSGRRGTSAAGRMTDE